MGTDLVADRSDRWIDFDDRIPKDGQKVLISKDGKTLEELFGFCYPDEDNGDSEVVGFLDGDTARYDGFVILKGNEKDIRWQPLPKPYGL